MTRLGSSRSSPSQSKTTVPSTSSLELHNSTGSEHSNSIISATLPTGYDAQNSQAQGQPEVISIVGGVIGGLAFLATVGVGTWIFLRIRTRFRRDINGGHPVYPRYPGGTVTPEGAMRPPRIQFHVGGFLLPSNLFPD